MVWNRLLMILKKRYSSNVFKKYLVPLHRILRNRDKCLNMSKIENPFLMCGYERIVSAPTSGTFIRTYHLNSVSSVQRALQFLLDEEFVYKSESGYIIYDRFMGMWLRRM